MAAVVLSPTCGKLGGPQSPSIKGPCTTERESQGPHVVLGIWGVAGLGDCEDVTCVVNIGVFELCLKFFL